MPESIINLLYLISEISIATVALSGITMVLAVTNLSLNDERASMIAVQLRMAFVVTASSIVPLLLLQYGIPEDRLWKLASILYLLSVGLNWLWSMVTPTSLSKLPLFARGLVACTAVVALLLLSANVWFAAAWPYLTQLCIGWASSTLLFLAFIHEVLITETGKGKDT